MRRIAGLSLLLFAAAGCVFADDLGRTALAVLEPDPAKLTATLHAALADRSPRVRAAAARVANVRRSAASLDDVRTALSNESDLRAAREEARALVMLGGTAELDRALAASARLDRRLDGAIAIAVARLGADVAVEQWFSRLHALPRVSDGSNFFRLALWGRPAMRNFVASRVLGEKDVRAFRIIANADPKPLDAPIAVAAMSSSSPDIRAIAVSGLLDATLAREPLAVPDVALPSLENPFDADAATAFRLEMLRRIAKLPPREDPRFVDYAGHELIDAPLRPLLTPAEKKALASSRWSKMGSPLGGRIPMRPQPVELPAFTAGSHLPDGTGAALVEETHCNDGWVGNAKVIDESGRVTATDLSDLATDGRCRTAVDALLRLSLAENRSLASPRSSYVLLARTRVSKPCTDEGEPVQTDWIGPLHVGGGGAGEAKAPVTKRRVEPTMPRTAHGDFLVITESNITRGGCISDMAILTQSPIPAINASTILALSEWEFAPGTVDGEPVEVVFHLLVGFRGSSTLMH